LHSLARRFAALVTTLLLASATTFVAGRYGLARLDRSLSSVVAVDMRRLMTITDLRRGIRTLVLLERDALIESDPAKVSALTSDIARARTKLAPTWERYAAFLTPEDAGDWKALREDFAVSSRIADDVLASLAAGRRDEAKARSLQHGSRWEALIKGLIERADRRLEIKAAETHAIHAWAQRAALFAFLVSGVLGIAAGWVVYRGIKKMLNAVLELKDRLLTANEGLERTVEERTRTIRAILDHVRFGFFLVGSDLRVTDGYTRSTLTLLDKDSLVDRPVTEALGFTGRAAENFEACLRQVFDDILPEELSCDQIPSRLERAGRILRLQVSAVRDAQGQVVQMLFGVSDVTSLEDAERANRESQALLAVLKNPEPFHRFVADVNERFGSIREAMQHADDGRVRRELHTIKGNASCFGLADLAKRAHLVEDLSPIVLDPILDLEREFEQFLTAHFDLLGIPTGGASPDPWVRVNGEALAALVEAVETPADAGDDAPGLRALRERLKGLVDALRERAVQDLVGPLARQVEELGHRLGKEVRFRMVGGATKVLPERVAPVLAVLPHALRNALDHGVEPRGERHGKDPCATLELAFEEVSHGLRIVVSDDGRGIDLVKVRAQALSRGLIAADAVLSDSEICALVFASRLSTADEVSEISGRGEGMSAVADAVAKARGRVEIRSSAGNGTRLIIELPKGPSETYTRAQAPQPEAARVS